MAAIPSPVKISINSKSRSPMMPVSDEPKGEDESAQEVQTRLENRKKSLWSPLDLLTTSEWDLLIISTILKVLLFPA